LEKTNTRADILSRKNQVDTKYDNKNMKMLKDELSTRKVSMEVEIIMFRENQIVEETTVTNSRP